MMQWRKPASAAFAVMRAKIGALSQLRKACVLALIGLNLLQAAMAATVPERINFQHLLENKDIVLGEASAFMQDSQGFMWIGGGTGLLRYDGYEFKPVTLNTPTEKGIVKSDVKMVTHIYEDPDKIMWISSDFGLLRYDPRQEILTRVPDDISTGITLSATTVKRTLALPSGELLTASAAGLMVLDRQTQKYSLLVPDSAKPKSLHSKKVQALYRDPAGRIWLGTEAGLELLDWAKKEFTLYKPYPEKSEAVPANSVTDIVADNDGKLWVATYDGLVNFDPENHTSKRYINDPDNPHSLGGNDVWTVIVDSAGALWVTSDGGGVSVFEKDQAFPKGRFTNHKFEPGRRGSINSNQVRTVFEDKIGDIWVGNYPNGINYYDRTSAAFTNYASDAANPNSLSHSSILSMGEDAQHNLWLGTDGGGLNYLNRQTGEFKAFKADPNNPRALSANAILSTFIDAEDNVWVGTWGGGVSILHPASGEFTRLPFDAKSAVTSSVSTSDRLSNAHVWSIKEDSQHNIWMTTHAGGLNKYDRKTKTFTHYRPNDADPKSLAGELVWNTFEDSSGRFWVCTAIGLDLMDRATGTFTHFVHDSKIPNSLSNASVLSAYEDSKKRIWFGTGGGLNLLNTDGKTFTVFDKASGFNNDTIRKIIEDKAGRLWISTSNGISVFDPETHKVKNYNRVSGQLIGSFFTGSGLISTAGELVFGGVRGLQIIDPNKLLANKIAPPLAFTDMKIFADSLAVGGPDGLLPESLNFTQTIVLDYKKSMFGLSFAALNFRDSNRNNYAYKLEGFDENWLQVGDQRSAKYTNLNAGRYQFRVKGSNNDGVWNDNGASITIIQLPPPWKTWWAYTLYALAVAAALVLFVMQQHNKRRSIEAQNGLLEARVNERTAQLRQKNNDIQAMLQNMPQGLFTVQEGEIIHPEYSRYLEDIFETQNIAGQKAADLLFASADIGSDARDSAISAILAIVGEDELNYGFNSPLLITEYNTVIGNRTKALALDWNPIVVDGIVDKLMVSVRDITQLRAMEAEAREQKRELDIVSQLIKLSSEKVLALNDAAQRYLDANVAALDDAKERDLEVLALLFRNMHTIKGNCRTYGFTYLSNVAHEVESTYSALKSSTDLPWEPSVLIRDIDLVRKVLGEYMHVYRDVLGKGDKSAVDHDGFWMHNVVMNKIEEYAERGDLPQLRVFIARIQSKPLEAVLADVVASLPSLAGQLGKQTPIVKFDASNAFMLSNSFELLSDVFAHILRNCIDHGIETPEERVNADKPNQGYIFIRSQVADDSLHIYVSDDGRGINLARLFERGIELGIWLRTSQPSKQEVAELIFQSGISTKDAITDISGRGVGLDAVKKFVIAQGGDVHLVLNSEREVAEGFSAFELDIQLPRALCQQFG